MNRPRIWLVSTVVFALLALAGWALSSSPRTGDRVPPRARAARQDLAASGEPRPPAPVTADATSVYGSAADVPRLALDCARREGNAAMIDSDALPVERVCARLSRIGGVGAAGVDRRQARLVLDQLIDSALVRRALAWERAAVTDAEVAAALAALPSRAPTPTPGDAASPADELLREQMRERLELRKLASLRARLEVTGQEVDTEVANGAPGIDRGQGVRVDGWLARMAPGADAGENPPAQQAAEGFALAVQTERPEAAAGRLGLTPLAPFVLGAGGVEPGLERAASGLAEGAWSGAVRTRVGWAVVRSLGRVEGQALTPDALRARVRQALENRRLQAARQDLLTSLRTAARVEVLVDM